MDNFSLVSKYRSSLMGFAALWIFIFHCYTPMCGNVPVISVIESSVKSFGYFGVDIFFMLSGIGLFFSLSGEGKILFYYYKRFKRLIVPTLVIAVAMYFAKWHSITAFFANISGYNFYTNRVYDFLWFIPAIATVYLLFPLYYKLFAKAKSKVEFTALVLLLYFCVIILLRGHISYDIQCSFINRLPEFIIGVYIGFEIKEKKGWTFSAAGYASLIIMFIIGVAILKNYFAESYISLFPGANTLFPALLISLSLVFLIPKLIDCGKGLKIIGKPVSLIENIFVFFGGISFELYCVQEFIFSYILQKMPDFINEKSILQNITVFILSILTAFGLKKLSDFIFSFPDKKLKPEKQKAK